MRRTAILTATVAAFAIAAPVAPANAGEAGYLTRLAIDYGYTITAETTPAALRAGYLLCDEMRNGGHRDELSASVYQAIPNATRDQAGGMVFAAHEELCPDAGSNIQNG
ncbi:DUF732 domain-containing protein [Mycolicibacterium komossense]|uniref:DUF732 domain-containing protein n=1 Tax=Mycolicibacterium komossense TaxID=1779 RepID=A0ABT3C9B7_9MYCO|nr:DUF732 domain-containing protein [Mycolicibacterium komossense]MCV7226078.1 DUF732 domain-containing protein [Mycolicibacterium komossense]